MPLPDDIAGESPSAAMSRVVAREPEMVTSVQEDFGAFVVARFPELHAVAAGTTGDCVVAAQVTATALASLADRWAELTTANIPTATARTAVLTAVLTITSSAGSTDTPDDLTPADGPGCSAATAAMSAALDAAPATARAALAATYYWTSPRPWSPPARPVPPQRFRLTWPTCRVPWPALGYLK